MVRTILLTIFAAAVLTVAFLFYKKMQPPTEAQKHEAWRRIAVEPENPNRPPEYQDMIYREGREELRTPASKK